MLHLPILTLPPGNCGRGAATSIRRCLSSCPLSLQTESQIRAETTRRIKKLGREGRPREAVAELANMAKLGVQVGLGWVSGGAGCGWTSPGECAVTGQSGAVQCGVVRCSAVQCSNSASRMRAGEAGRSSAAE